MVFGMRLRKSAVKMKAVGSRGKKDKAERDAAKGMVVAPVVGLDPLALRDPANADNTKITVKLCFKRKIQFHWLALHS
jgi:hypothetical protein